MHDLDNASDGASVGYYEEASTFALISIARSLETLARMAVATHGVCVDCHHNWTNHYDRPDLGGCHAIIIAATGQPRTCPCTEPRPAAG